MRKLKQLFCSHRFRPIDTDVIIDKENGIVTYTDTCVKCGKKLVNIVPYLAIFGELDRITNEIKGCKNV